MLRRLRPDRSLVVVTGLGSLGSLEQPSGMEAVRQSLCFISCHPTRLGQVCGRKGLVQVRRDQRHQIVQCRKPAGLHNFVQRAIHGAESAASSPGPWVMSLVFGHVNQNDLELEVWVVKQRWDADKLLEERVDVAPFRRCSRLRSRFV